MSLFNSLRKEKKLDEIELQKLMARGERAKALMKDELLAEAFDAVERVYLASWRDSAAGDVDHRERCHISVNLLNDLKGQLLNVVRDGVAAENQLKLALERKRRKPLK